MYHAMGEQPHILRGSALYCMGAEFFFYMCATGSVQNKRDYVGPHKQRAFV